jgi:hypothetical protein
MKNSKVTHALNIGSSDVSRWIPNTEGLDIIDHGQKWVCSIFDFKPPYKYETIFAHHFFEHFIDTVALMEKVGSLLEIGGILDIRVPTVPYPQAFIDPTHVKYIPKDAELFFSYFTDKAFGGHCLTKVKFEIVGIDRDRFEWEAHITLKRIE